MAVLSKGFTPANTQSLGNESFSKMEGRLSRMEGRKKQRWCRKLSRSSP